MDELNNNILQSNDCYTLASRRHYRLALFFTMITTFALFFLAPNEKQQIIILFLFAGLIGVPHGLTDWWLLQNASKSLGFIGSQRQLIIIGAAIYCILITAFLLFWYFAPVAALMVFLSLSIWHFGMQDVYAYRFYGWQEIFHALLRGASLIAIIYISHKDTAEYFNLMTFPNIFSSIPL
ncbi:MAG: Brp/Blh family beta-carotene 15,15'-dioxygenase, partial [Pseudomonadota bacterium]